MAELNGKYINEENHQKVKGKLNKAGKGLIIAGGICLGFGILAIIAGIIIITLTNEMAAIALIMPGAFIGFIIGIPMLAFGMQAKIAANAREIAAYGATSVLPVAGEALNYAADEIAPSVGRGIGTLGKGLGDAAGGIAGGIAEGVRKAKRDLACPECGEKNVNDAKFCAKCGYKFAEKQEKKKTFCPNCGDECEEGQKFCEKCGHKLINE